VIGAGKRFPQLEEWIMRTLGRIALVLTCVALLAAPAVTQQQKGKRGGGFGGGMGMGGGNTEAALLANPSVQKELKLSEDQIAKVKEVSQKVNEKYASERQEIFKGGGDFAENMAKMRELGKKSSDETMKDLAGTLKPDQEKRLKQIVLQQEGVNAFKEAPVQTALKLNDEQKENLKTIADDLAKDLREMMPQFGKGGKGGGGKGKGGADFQELQQKREAVQKEAMDKAVAVLKADQKTTWKEMTGTPFKVEMTFGRGGKGKKQDQE
jgi:hypothetical protein